MTERTWQMTRLAPGDYLLPSNDASRLWRIHRYWENGSAFWGSIDTPEAERRYLRGWFWTASYYVGGEPWQETVAAALQAEDDDVSVRDRYWHEWGTSYRTRQAAIDDALARP